MNRRRLTPPTHIFVLEAPCTVSICFWHLIQRDVFPDWINKIVYLSGNGGLTVYHFPLLVPIASDPVVREICTRAVQGYGLFWLCRTFLGDPADFFVCEKNSEFFLCLKLFDRKIYTFKVFEARFFCTWNYYCQKFLRVKIFESQNIFSSSNSFMEIFWFHTCIFVGDFMVSVTFFYDRARNFCAQNFMSCIFFCENFLVRFFLHVKKNL